MKPTRIKVRWIIVPLVLWLGAEVVIGKFFSHNLRWYEAAEAELRAGPPVDEIFIGSSRVNAAIDAAAIEQAASRLSGKPFRVLNLGYGDTNLTEHYLGLRYLFEAHPEKLQGVTVLIEAAGGMPEYREWSEPWVAGNLSAVLPLLKVEDLSQIWQTDDTFENKTEVTLRLATRWSNVMARKDKVQQYAFMVNDSVIAPRIAPRAETAGDLTADGGIRADEEGIKQARALAIRVSNEQLSHPQPDIRNWDNQVAASIVRFVKARGGRVLFFEVPLSSVMRAPLKTPTMRANAKRFAQTAASWGCPVVRSDFATNDLDFPDLWHMRKSIAANFSRALNDVIIERKVQ